MGGFVEKSKPYVAMIALQLGYAGMNVLTKVSLNQGMSHYVLVVYRHAFAALSVAPFALVVERYSNFWLLLVTCVAHLIIQYMVRRRR
jgi:hypothetical protein